MLAVDSLLKFPCQYEEAVFDQLVEFSWKNNENVIQYMMMYYSEIMKNKIMKFMGKWFKLETTILGEII